MQCSDCRHRRTIPGSEVQSLHLGRLTRIPGAKPFHTHMRCDFDWGPDPLRTLVERSQATTAQQDHISRGQALGWFDFPIDFDPTLVPPYCPGWSHSQRFSSPTPQLRSGHTRRKTR